jgi:hypothetical protein
MHGVSFFSSRIGIIAETVFLKMSGGLATTFPPRWNLPWLLKGNESDPSNCSNLTEELPSRSKTKALVCCATCARTLSRAATMFSGVGIQPRTELSTYLNDVSLKYGVLYFRLLEPMSTTFCSWVSDCRQSLLSAVLTRRFSGLEHALKFEKMQVSKLLSNSQQVSLDNP